MSERGDDAEDEVIELTPSVGFDIRNVAGDLVSLMTATQQALRIHIPHAVVEFECGCTRQQIIDGYYEALKSSIAVEPSNGNSSGAKKK
jgi:hypothetical protein